MHTGGVCIDVLGRLCPMVGSLHARMGHNPCHMSLQIRPLHPDMAQASSMSAVRHSRSVSDLSQVSYKGGSGALANG